VVDINLNLSFKMAMRDLKISFKRQLLRKLSQGLLKLLDLLG
jgi:hypothetical protein